MNFEEFKNKYTVRACTGCGMDMDLVELLMIVIPTTNDIADPLKNGILQKLLNIKRRLEE